MLDEKTNSLWWKVGTVVLSVAAIIVSIRSCALSNRAVSLSETSFVINNRPYLIVSPDKPKSRDSFITCTSTPAGTETEILFKVQNVGETPAYAIRVDDAKIEMHFSNSSGEDVADRVHLDLQLVLPDKLTLGPNQKCHLVARFLLDKLKNQTERMKGLLDVGAKLPVEIVVSYDSILGDTTTRYTSTTKAFLRRDSAEIITSKMK